MHRQCEMCGTAGWSKSVLCIDSVKCVGQQAGVGQCCA